MSFSEEITSINKEITNLYRNAEDNERGSRGDLGVGGVSGETFHVCECCANLIFNKTIDPTRTKTVLLIGMLVDQIVHHYYNPVHEDFEKKHLLKDPRQSMYAFFSCCFRVLHLRNLQFSCTKKPSRLQRWWT